MRSPFSVGSFFRVVGFAAAAIVSALACPKISVDIAQAASPSDVTTGYQALFVDDNVAARDAFRAAAQQQLKDFRPWVGLALSLAPSDAFRSSDAEMTQAVLMAKRANALATTPSDKLLTASIVRWLEESPLDIRLYRDAAVSYAAEHHDDSVAVLLAARALRLAARRDPPGEDVLVEFRAVRAELARRPDWGSLDTIALSNLTALDAIIGDRDRVLSEAQKLETATIAPHDATLLEPAIDAEIGFGTYARARAESKTLVELDTKLAAQERTPVESAPRYGDHLILWFGTAFVSGQLDEEEQAFANVARVVPWYPIVGYIRHGRFAEARKLADSFGEQALIDHGTWQLRYYAALAYKFTGRTDLAKQILDKMIADDSGRGADHVAVLVLRGSLPDTSSDDRTAEANLREAVRSLSALPAGTVLPWELMPRVTLAGYEFGHEHYQMAVDAAREETSLHPDCIQALRLLYRSYIALGDVTHADDIRKMISASVQRPTEPAAGSTPSP